MADPATTEPADQGCYPLGVVVTAVCLVVALPFAVAPANHLTNGARLFVIWTWGVLITAIWARHVLRLSRARFDSPPLRPATVRRLRRFRRAAVVLVFVGVEIALVGLFISRAYVWEWWRDGKRFEGIVTDVHLPADATDGSYRLVTITNRELERSVVIRIGRWPWADWKRVGDGATAVLMPDERFKGSGPGDLQSYVVAWASLPLLAIAWTVAWMRLIGGDSRQR